jgi:hypothetical protein
MLGKKTMVNNFCIGIGSNQPYGTSYHIGYGWKDNSFDFSAEENVDCLACHDTKGTYRKPSGLAGHPFTRKWNFTRIGPGFASGRPDESGTESGKSSRYNCVACHSYGGGDGVKHGDLIPRLKHLTWNSTSKWTQPDSISPAPPVTLPPATGHEVPGCR